LQNNVFKLYEVFLELGIRVFLENGLGSWKFPDISYFSDLRQTRGVKKIPKTVLKTRINTKETTYNLVFVKSLVVYFQSHSIRAF
jgi:hypothetical protein